MQTGEHCDTTRQLVSPEDMSCALTQNKIAPVEALWCEEEASKEVI